MFVFYCVVINSLYCRICLFNFVSFLSMIIYEVLYTWCLRYNICSAWLLDVKISTCYSREVSWLDIALQKTCCLTITRECSWHCLWTVLYGEYIYCILLIIRGEKLSPFYVFTFIPDKTFMATGFTSFHSIHVQKFAKTLLRLQSNPQKCKSYSSRIISNIQ